MPTCFSKCKECSFIECLGLDHVHNKNYKNNLETLQIFKNLGLPTELGIIIIKKTYEYTNCNCCGIILCQNHYLRALKYGRHYRHLESYAMCDQCCWNEIT